MLYCLVARDYLNDQSINTLLKKVSFSLDKNGCNWRFIYGTLSGKQFHEGGAATAELARFAISVSVMMGIA